MEYAKIPHTDISLSRITLGTWAIGGWMWGGTDEAESIQTIHAAIERGVTGIDTAPVYGFGRSEQIVGQALAESRARHRVTLATKVGLEWDDQQRIRRNSSPERIRREVEDSLRRLQTDHIDLYQVHWPDEKIPFEDTAAELDKLRDEGKVRAVGVSNYSPEQMESFRKKTALSSCQPPYNLFERGIEERVLPYCKETGVMLVTYGALCRGLLSGKMTKDRSFDGDDLRQVDPKFQPPRLGEYLEAVDQLEQFARERHDQSVLALAVRWILDKGVEVALWGARKPEQLDQVDQVFSFSLSSDELRELEALVDKTVTHPEGPEFMAPPKV